jgi:DNA-binding transcriptional MerR regulator
VQEGILPEQTYFSIGEVAKMTHVEAYVIRYWESQFGALRPPRRESGQRKFTRRDIDLILRIRELLYDKRFTIDGARRFLQEEVRKGTAQLKLELGDTDGKSVELLRSARKDLEEALRILKSSSPTTAERY